MSTEFNLGEKIKSLRKTRDLTQEQFGDFLGVSYQAVSKWETNAAIPDVTMFPVLARFFGVTTDELFGMDETRDRERINAYHTESNKMRERGKHEDLVPHFRGAVKEFPNENGLWSELACALSASQSSDDLNEAREIYERVLENNPSVKLRASVLINLCQIYVKTGEREKGVDLARTLPHIYESREFALPRVLDGHERQEALILLIHGAVDMLCASLHDRSGNPETSYNMDVSVRLGEKVWKFDIEQREFTRRTSSADV
ncbi:hypothetical protein FACS1894219_05370 [Clostridia bacterium]|nr:hypothetical protein FACS1894219_05370 [Clostridia bacterium]